MLAVNRVSKSFNLSPILHDISFAVSPGERVGLIGPNGSGKTTLLRILVGQEPPDSGHVALGPADRRLGYLAQGLELDPRTTLAEALHAAAPDPRRLADELADLGAALAAEPGRDDLHQAYDRVLDQLNQAEGGRAAAVLAHLGLDALEPEQPVGELSGGQKTRLALALVLLGEPDVLLLDEPTNHLDIAMLEWLEAWLAGYPGAALIVSHDRTFLDHTVTRILDLDPIHHTLRAYEGNYSDYLDQYLAERERQSSAWRDQADEIRRIRQDIARTREQARHVEITTKPNQPGVRRIAKKVARKAASREKKLERYLESEERVDRPERSWQMKLAFDTLAEAHIGRDVLTLEELAVGYDRPLLAGLNLTIRAGQRVVLTGPNGAGKTTLLRTIAGRLPPLAGRARLGASVRLGIMSQEQENLDPAATPLATILNAATMTETEARSFLHYFLFEGDDPLRPIAELSFGERSRLSLARLVAEGCTFLLLDEPINHLDIPSRTRFEEALAGFPGTILAVVHDRYFIERFATDLWLVEEGRVAWEPLVVEA
ncbi:MAG: ABC-F family ATP-binding cassette domain-containing protein [Candidatus Promineofilum sp.]|nr:ABC-F family ATP-binding cassette domain-containing protein [Promineifilum sp.]